MGETRRFLRFASGSPGPSIEEQQEAWRQDANNPDRGAFPLPPGPVLDSADIEEGNGADAFKPFGRN